VLKKRLSGNKHFQTLNTKAMDLFSVEVLIPFGFFGMIILLVYLSYRKKMRMAMIERGLDPNSLDNFKKSNTTVKFGLFLAAIGLGVLIANGITAMGWLSEEVAFLSMVFIFGGAALIGGGFLDRKEQK